MHDAHDPCRRLLLRAPLLAAVAAALPAAAATTAAATAAPAASATDAADPARAFDFFLGRWQVRYRRLRERLAGQHEWEEFDGHCKVQTLFGGLAQFDESVVNRPGLPYRGLALRSFDPATRSWADWWLDTRNPQRIAAPMIGGFAGGAGRFFGDSEWRGQPIKVRGLWNDLGADGVRWEQAFSADGGASWETNWVSRYRRIG